MSTKPEAEVPWRVGGGCRLSLAFSLGGDWIGFIVVQRRAHSVRSKGSGSLSASGSVGTGLMVVQRRVRGVRREGSGSSSTSGSVVLGSMRLHKRSIGMITNLHTQNYAPALPSPPFFKKSLLWREERE